MSGEDTSTRTIASVAAVVGILALALGLLEPLLLRLLNPLLSQVEMLPQNSDGYAAVQVNHSSSTIL